MFTYSYVFTFELKTHGRIHPEVSSSPYFILDSFRLDCLKGAVFLIPFFFLTSQTPEKRSHNGYTNLPDVVQPSHSPTDPAPHSSPGKDSVYDVSFPAVVVILP